MTGDDVRRLRKALGITQAELAAALGVARNTVARWEMGTVTVRETAARLMATLKPRRRGTNARNR